MKSEGQKNYEWLDLFRGLAAMLVLINHLRSLLLTDYDNSGSYFKSFLYFITGFGHQAVVVFFVLSGFFITKTIQESYYKKTWSFQMYFVNRLSRLWTVLIPSLLFTLVLDKIGVHLFPRSYIYLGTLQYMPRMNPLLNSGVKEFLGNLFFLQGILVKTFGTNPPLWSLANEFWYYIIFPLFLFSIKTKYALPKRVFLFLLAIGCLVFVGKDISLYFLIWLMGSCVYYISNLKQFKPIAISILKWISLLLFGLSLYFIRSNKYILVFNDYTLGLVTSIMVIVFLNVKMHWNGLQSLSKFLSKISYTVYLFHLSFLAFTINLFITGRMIYSVSSLIICLAYLVASLCYCYICFLLFENRTALVKKKLIAIFKLKNSINSKVSG
jgi:peptidoglycan/LPS O-acetylase OafA/YrhL